MIERVNILKPMLERAVSEKQTVWPTYDGGFLDRTQYVSSSEIGRCAREIWFRKNFPPTEGMANWGFAERGHGHEAWIVATLAGIDAEYQFDFHGEDQVSFYAGCQSGTPDGLWYGNQKIVVDYKSIDPRTKRANLPKPEHIKQVVQNADLIEECLDIEVDGMLLAYSDASNFQLIDEYYIDRKSPKVGEMMIDLERRAEAIMSANSAEDVEPEGLFTGGCKTCQFGSQCTAAIVASKQEKQRNDTISNIGKGVFG